ncbi:hypothetical protein B2J93_451 [Marssonina coronariae]|uniref:Uncharacterized protein n=1 Tax=Diplocarpon coronariae TaxID=2795749 RepID=A0A218ZFT0_9HELO|nr:hypothetical protein B2J93_451 [Marssonina coronariae]
MLKPTTERNNASDRTLVLGGPATPTSSSIAASPAPGVLFSFAPGPFSLDPFAPIAAAAPILAAAPAAFALVTPAVPPAFAPAVANVFASRPLAEGVLVGLS